LYEFIRQESIDIMLINETKFNKNSKLTKFLGYNFIRQDRPDSINGGGLLIIVNNTIKFSELPTKQLNTIEALGIKLANNIEIYSVYVRPKNTGKTNKIDPNELKQLMINSRTILLGDFNAKHTDWHCSIKNTNGNILTNLTDNNHFEILAPDRYTLYPTNGGKPKTINDLDSDHLPLILTLNQTNTIKLDTKTVLNYKKANWQQFREIINDSIIINSNINSKEKIDKCIKNLTNTINDAISIAIPEIEITAKIKPLPDHIILLIKNRNKLRRQYQRTGNKLIKIQKETLAQNIKQLITEHRNDQWDKKLQNLKVSDNSIWQTAKALTKKTINKIPTLHGPQGLAFTDKEKANVLAEYFEQVHHLTEHESDETTENLVNTEYDHITDTIIDSNSIKLISPREIRNIIKKTKSKKAPGHDGIQNIILKNLPSKALVQLTHIFNNCMKQSYFPSTWKTATVLAFPKPGKNSLFPQSYRPISLLCTLSKILETIILKRIKIHETENKNLIAEQFGFREHHATDLQLARIVNFITTKFNWNKSTAIVLLDIEKAFDTVWHQALLYKLHKLEIPIYIIKLLQHYLTNRQIQVQVNDTLSEKQKTVAGVPQGSILGPILFLYYINDIPKDNNTNLALFADDTALYNVSGNKRIALDRLQKYLDTLIQYYTKWKIKINEAKTELIIISKRIKIKKNEDNLTININNTIIEPKTNAKYLGVILDNKLTYVSHINKACSNAKSIKHILYPLIGHRSKLSIKNKLILYKSMIKPILLYAAPIWSSASNININKIKTIENKILRMISNARLYERNDSIKSRLNIDEIYNDIH
ncbi:GSCOCG00006977001-RA-CDS, partial [Cotesia congregata]